jgi:hypothetical protein
MDVQVSSHAWQLECIQGTLLASLEAVKKLWKEARTHTQDRMDALEKCLVDHDSPGTDAAAGYDQCHGVSCVHCLVSNGACMGLLPGD